ncbi:MAG: archaeosortase/exosortase family protein [Reichenbachiella sp.]
MKIDKKVLIKTFLIKAAIVFVVWQIAYHGFIKPNETIDNTLTEWVTASSVFGLTLLGFDSSSIDNVIYINEIQSVKVANGCNGLELVALFLGFLICFPGNLKSKIVYGIFGSIAIELINILREITLALNYNYFRATFDINHKYTYALLVYAFVFIVWKHWIERYSVIAKKHLQ